MIPNLPTDNLYKFMALAGLTITVAGGVFTDASMSPERWQKIGEPATKATEAFNAKAEEFLSRGQRITGAAPPNGEFGQRQALPVDQFTFLRRLALEADKENQRAVSRATVIQNQAQLGVWIIFIGILIAAFGFVEWYSKFQVYANRGARHAVGVRRSDDDREFNFSRPVLIVFLLNLSAVFALSYFLTLQIKNTTLPTPSSAEEWLNSVAVPERSRP